jgi:hypothetical protein
MKANAKSIAATTGLVLVISQVAAKAVQDPDESLKAIARAHGGKARLMTHSDLPLPTLDDVVATADLIVEGVIRRAEPSLSPDERIVLTWFTLEASRVWKDMVAARLSPKPGPAPDVVFIEPGGTVQTEGLEIVHISNIRADPPLNVGERVIVFLKRDSSLGAYRLHYGPFGLLRVSNGHVAAANKGVAKRRPLETTHVARIRLKLERLVDASPKRNLYG